MPTSSAFGGHGAFGELEPGPDVHVDHDRDHFKDLGLVEVTGETVVSVLEALGDGGVGCAGQRLGVAQRGLFDVG